MHTFEKSSDGATVDVAVLSGRRLGVLALAITTMLALVATPAYSANSAHSTNPVFTIPPPAQPPDVVGSSTLVRTDRGVSVTLETSGLEPGHVVTLWWVVANSPEECTEGLGPLSQCGPGDHVAGRGGHVCAPRHRPDRQLGWHRALWSTSEVGDTSRALFEGEPGLLDARGAEVIVVLKTHGPKIPGMVSDQLRTFAGGCADQSTPPGLIARPGMLGAPGGNDCAEIQFSVHRP